MVKEDASEEVRRHPASWPGRFSLRLREAAEWLLRELLRTGPRSYAFWVLTPSKVPGT